MLSSFLGVRPAIMPPQRRSVEGHVLSNSAGRVLPPTLGVEQIMPRGVLWGKAAPKQKARDKLFAPEGADMDTGMSRGTVGGVLRQKAAGRYSDSGGDGLQSGKLTGAPDWMMRWILRLCKGTAPESCQERCPMTP